MEEKGIGVQDRQNFIIDHSSWVTSLNSHETGNCVGSGFSGASTASSDGPIIGTAAGNVQVLVNGGSAPSVQGSLVSGSAEPWLRLSLHTHQR